MRKLLYLLIILLCLFGVYFFIFIKPSVIKEGNLLSFCNNQGNTRVMLMDSFHYIDKVETQKVNDTIILKVYLTTIGNFITKNKKIDFTIEDKASYIKIGNRIVKTSDIENCK